MATNRNYEIPLQNQMSLLPETRLGADLPRLNEYRVYQIVLEKYDAGEDIDSICSFTSRSLECGIRKARNFVSEAIGEHLQKHGEMYKGGHR